MLRVAFKKIVAKPSAVRAISIGGKFGEQEKAVEEKYFHDKEIEQIENYAAKMGKKVEHKAAPEATESKEAPMTPEEQFRHDVNVRLQRLELEVTHLRRELKARK
eukprot:TRINITY_DN221_c0_g1_i2.p1 TRINITY_DN221_c0_g1~~TRINITY_DN221_c0_g1_i2.p1  ORF type:complete len:120 (-),score=71.82 TRINITY_DN221_c0_g1_i2:128-442(-)